MPQAVDVAWDVYNTDEPLTLIDQQTVAWIDKQKVQHESGWIGFVGKGMMKAITNALLKDGNFLVTFKGSIKRATWFGFYYENTSMTLGVGYPVSVAYGAHGMVYIEKYTVDGLVPSTLDRTDSVVEMELSLNIEHSSVVFIINGVRSQSLEIQENTGVIPAICFHNMDQQVSVSIVKLE
jgi:hypothetical protein